MSLATARHGLLPRVRAHCADEAAAQRCHALAGRLLPWLDLAALTLGASGLAFALLVAPSAPGQREAFRILFIHTPAAWLSLLVFVLMALCALLGLLLKWQLATMLACALAPTGALMTVVALWTGALWGKPTGGTWWAWDARLDAELLLLALYVVHLVLQGAGGDTRRMQRTVAAVALAGGTGAPLLYLLVQWGQGLSPGANADAALFAARHATVPLALALTSAAAIAYVAAAALHRLRSIIVERESGRPWVNALHEGAI